jgi:uncharacterized DUF497 family protein
MRIEYAEPAADWIEDKLLSKHQVRMEEVEQVLWGDPDIRKAGRDERGEMHYGAVGRTAAGRWLTVFFLLGPGPTAAVLSARDSTRAERRLH